MTDKEILISKIKEVTGLSESSVISNLSKEYWSKKHRAKVNELIASFEKLRTEYLERLEKALNG